MATLEIPTPRKEQKENYPKPELLRNQNATSRTQRRLKQQVRRFWQVPEEVEIKWVLSIFSWKDNSKKAS